MYSSPAGAGILIDGVYLGTTPKILPGIPSGNHILRLTLSGYHDYEGSIYVVAGQTTQGYGTLQPLSQVVSPAPTTTVVVPVVVPVVTAPPEPAQDTGLLGNSGVLAAIIGAIGVVIASFAKIYTHGRQPPKKE
ncbi:MAG TPA: PEGA domain-containing protein [Methanoregula sp.]|nr:PEGA domain-containing protein [Methanoregula sp.]